MYMGSGFASGKILKVLYILIKQRHYYLHQALSTLNYQKKSKFKKALVYNFSQAIKPLVASQFKF